ncbi:hypothetical protein ACJ73_02376 [Blastomyces percursus]|uniref:Tyrosinase copper-binding domain-containing protein n=1 Tax=Blastomyces percursus TaxID=1658174 RepID=A0A1J9QCR0_9EURO|nr:hypothetical protein ACJ73_02376 [Blastomyces percursus]
MVDVVIPRLRLPGRIEKEWLEAAYQWRLPFWDWAKNPKILDLMRKSRFQMSNGKEMGIYGLGTLKSPDFEDTLEIRVRNGHHYPISRSTNIGVHASGTGNVTLPAVVRPQHNTAHLSDGFRELATTARDAIMDSSNASKVTNDMNIEFIHNNIHYWVGGNGGHMSRILVATF